MKLVSLYRLYRHILLSKSMIFKNTPVELTYFVTSKCNATCPHCFYHEELNNVVSDLTLEEVDSAFKKSPNLMRLLFSGGEPFVRPDFVDVVKTIYKHSKPLYISIPTNATLTKKVLSDTEEILKSCPLTQVNISMSVLESNDKTDDFFGVRNTYRKFCETYAGLKDLQMKYPNLLIGFIVTQTASNQSHVIDIYDSAQSKFGPDYISVSLARNSALDESELDVDISIYKKLQNHISKFAQKTMNPVVKLLRFFDDICADYITRVFETNKFSGLICYSGSLRLVLNFNGDIYPCETLMLSEKKDSVIGNVSNGMSIKELVKSDRAKLIQGRIINNQCFCRHECDVLTNIMFSPKRIMQYLFKV